MHFLSERFPLVEQSLLRPQVCIYFLDFCDRHYNLGLSYLFDKHYEKAIEHFKKAINTIELRLDNTEKKIVAEEKEKGKENVDPGSPLISWRKEVEELKGLLPDMAAKVNALPDQDVRLTSYICLNFSRSW